MPDSDIPFDFERFCMSHGVAMAEAGSRHHRAGWIHIDCPHCRGGEGMHLGFYVEGNFFTCWRCGRHSKYEVVAQLLMISPHAAYETVEAHRLSGSRTREAGRERKKQRQKQQRIAAQRKFTWPDGKLDKLGASHCKYMHKRGFDPVYLERIWKCFATGHLGNHKFRICSPVWFDNQMVSYVGRDITDKNKAKYKPCPEELEVRKHKHCLYGEHLIPPVNESIVVVEGMTDAWRLGPGAVATLGTKFTPIQVELIAAHKKSWIIFDDEDEAQEQAEKLAHEASLRPDHTSVVVLLDNSKDPGSLSLKDAESVMRQLVGQYRGQ